MAEAARDLLSCLRYAERELEAIEEPSAPSSSQPGSPQAVPAPRSEAAERRSLRRTGGHSLGDEIDERSLGDLLVTQVAGFDAEMGGPADLAILTLRALHDDLFIMARALEQNDSVYACLPEHVSRLADKALVGAELAGRMRRALEGEG